MNVSKVFNWFTCIVQIRNTWNFRVANFTVKKTFRCFNISKETPLTSSQTCSRLFLALFSYSISSYSDVLRIFVKQFLHFLSKFSEFALQERSFYIIPLLSNHSAPLKSFFLFQILLVQSVIFKPVYFFQFIPFRIGKNTSLLWEHFVPFRTFRSHQNIPFHSEHSVSIQNIPSHSNHDFHQNHIIKQAIISDWIKGKVITSRANKINTVFNSLKTQDGLILA